MDHNQFVEAIWREVAKCPNEWRKGQSVFNVIDREFGVARYVQFEKRIDCFYNDDMIDKFIEESWKVLNNES